MFTVSSSRILQGRSWNVNDEPSSRETPPCHLGALAITAALAQFQPDTMVCTVTGAINKDTMPVLRDALAEERCDDK
jgi:hypothetical protein